MKSYNFKINKMESPYTFDPSNSRKVHTLNGDEVVPTNKVYIGTGALYFMSLYMYSRKFLRIDGNAVTAAAFAGASLPAAYAYARFFLSDAETEAALLNNSKEA
jgi:hypothetical protein